MKIAILTQPLGHNYGGMMQAWALQQVLKSMGHEPVTIDRQPDAYGLARRSARAAYRVLRAIVGKGNALPAHMLPIVTKNTRDFIRANIMMSPMIDSTEKLRAHFIDVGYEAVIVGSDQTWRPRYSPNIYNFFLDFLPNRAIKKIAFATSFGVDHWEFSFRQTQKCSQLARDFDFISVRETSGAKLCADRLGVTAETVLDPTLLLTANDYRALINKYEHKHEGGAPGGIYTYFLDKTPDKDAIVQEVAMKLGLNIFNCQATCGFSSWQGRATEQYIMPPVTDWLSGFDRANFVLTDSFHGMVFSIVFGKPFLAIANQARGAARFESLLSQLDLRDRLIFTHQRPRNQEPSMSLSSAYSDALSLQQYRSRLALEMHL